MAKKVRRGGKRKGQVTPRLTRDELAYTRLVVETAGSITEAANQLKLPRKTISYRYNEAVRQGIGPEASTGAIAPSWEDSKVHASPDGTYLTIQYMGAKIETPEQLINDCDIDMKHWYISDVNIKNWEVAGKKKSGQHQNIHTDSEGTEYSSYQNLPEKLWKTGLRSIHVKLKRKQDDRIAFEEILRQMKDNSIKVPRIKYPKAKKGTPRRALELTIMDPHMGLNCFTPGSDHAWSLEDCEAIALWAVDSLIEHAATYGPFEEIVFPFGNDFMHHDNLVHTTTGGTTQPEGMPWHYVYERAIQLAFEIVDRMKAIAPVKIYQIPGNHDRETSFTLGHVLWAKYFNDDNVQVDASSSPYKFWKYGTNLLGFEHGHSVRPIRLAALMANECSGPGPRQGWWDTTSYREWHLGDQHRKGSGKPSMHEEQGVSVEYLPGLTPPNEWHRLKAFNWQKRGAMGFVWNYDKGPEARIQVNINSYTGAPTGMSKKEIGELFSI